MAVIASFLFAQFGLIAAIYAHNFDTLSMYSNFLILPLVYLGGVFIPFQSFLIRGANSPISILYSTLLTDSAMR